jgi:AcrR family transcriptional regulator
MPSIEPRLSARERSQMETHRRLLEHGTRLFASQGVSRARATDIARAASVAVGTLYLHFKDKDGLLHEVLVVGIGKLRLPLRVLAEERSLPFTQVVRRHVEVMVDFVLQHGDLARVMFHPEVFRSPIGADVVDFMALTAENLLREGMATGDIRSDIDATVASQALVGMLLHVLSWWVESTDRATRQEVIDTLVAFHLATLVRN